MGVWLSHESLLALLFVSRVYSSYAGCAMRPFIEILRNEEGATSVEYAVVLALILMAIFGAIGSLGAQTGGLWGGIVGDLADVGFF